MDERQNVVSGLNIDFEPLSFRKYSTYFSTADTLYHFLHGTVKKK